MVRPRRKGGSAMFTFIYEAFALFLNALLSTGRGR